MSAQNGPERPRGGKSGAVLERTLSGFGRARRAGWNQLASHGLTLATVAALVGAALLVLSSFLDVVRFVDLRGQLIPGAEATREGTVAMAVIGIAAGVAALFARWAEHSLPALACAALGAIALAIVLIGDLPDVTSSGLTSSKEIGEAEPGAGLLGRAGRSGGHDRRGAGARVCTRPVASQAAVLTAVAHTREPDRRWAPHGPRSRLSYQR